MGAVTCSHRVDDKMGHGIQASKFLSLQDNSLSCLAYEMVGKYHPQILFLRASLRTGMSRKHSTDSLLSITEQGKTLGYPSALGASRSHLRDGICLIGPPSSDPNILEFTNSFLVSYLKIPH